MLMIYLNAALAKIYLVLILAALRETNILSSIFLACLALREALYLGLCIWDDCSAHFYFNILGPTSNILIIPRTQLTV
jgi:hypothetical protein